MADSSLPSVSVIIPAHNAASFVSDAIQSVYAQDYSRIEVVLIDDGSVDDTSALVQRRFPLVRVIRQKNAGVAAARNAGLREATGDLVCFLDADDVWLPGKLSAQVQYMTTHQEVGLLFHRWHVWEPDGAGNYVLPEIAPASNPVDVVPEASGWLHPLLLLDCIIQTSTVMIRRETYEAVGFFDTSLASGEDYDYWLRTAHCCEQHQLAATLSCYRVTPGSLSQKVYPVSFEYQVVLRAIERWGLPRGGSRGIGAGAIRGRLSNLAFDHGYRQFKAGLSVSALGGFRTAIKHDPLHMRAWAYLVVSWVNVVLSHKI